MTDDISAVRAEVRALRASLEAQQELYKQLAKDVAYIFKRLNGGPRGQEEDLLDEEEDEE